MSEAFFSRWARLKRDRHRGAAEERDDGGADSVPTPAPVPPVADLSPGVALQPGRAQPGREPADEPAHAPARSGPETGPATREPGLPAPEPELPPLESLTPESDFRPFLNKGVPPATRNAALKTLFSDPHFNVMDGLDVYIEDYNQTEPIPDELMRRLAQARTLGLFDEEERDAERREASTPAPTPAVPDIAAAEPEAGRAPPVDRPPLADVAAESRPDADTVRPSPDHDAGRGEARESGHDSPLTGHDSR